MRNIYSDKPKKESFFANHVKLITFLIVIGVFLLITVPIFVMNATRWFGAGMDTRPKMTQRDVILLSELEMEAIPLDRVTQFACEEDIELNVIKVEVKIDPHYTMYVVANKNTHRIVSCRLVNEKRSEEKDVLKDDMQAYFDYVKRFE